MKMKTNENENPKPMGHCTSSTKGKVHSNNAYLNKEEKSQIT